MAGSNKELMRTEIKDRIIGAYEDLAVSYNEMIDHKPHNAYYDRPNTLALLPDIKARKVLDVACGPGKYAEILMERGAEVTGFDVSPKMIELAKSRNQGRGTFFVHDMNEPIDRLSDAQFDVIICALAMHYIKDWSLVIKEFYRMLKSGGVVVLSVEHPFFEYTYFKSDRYFGVEPVSCTWSGFGKNIEMHSYRRSLMECITPFTENGFYLDQLVEPKPVPEFEQLDPRHFNELNQFPAFMHMRMKKKK